MVTIHDDEIRERMRKKIIIALTEKGRSPIPQIFDYDILFGLLAGEVNEFWEAICKKGPDDILDELADVLNFLEYIYKKLKGDRTPYEV